MSNFQAIQEPLAEIVERPIRFIVYKLTAMIRNVAKYLFRQVPTEAASGYANVEKIEGNSVAFNQLVQNGDFSGGLNGYVFENSSGTVSNNELNINIPSGSAPRIRTTVSLQSGHVYYITETASCTSTSGRMTLQVLSGAWVTVYQVYFSTTTTTYSGIFTAPSVINGIVLSIYRSDVNTVDTTANISNIQLIDLTHIFGAGNEPTTVADFEAWLAQNIGSQSYYAYNAGELLSVKMSGVKSVGFNQWDENVRYGKYSNSTGQFQSSSVNLCNVNPIKVAPNTIYYTKNSIDTINIYFYDANNNLISYKAGAKDATFETPLNCHYINFFINSSYGTTYNNDICINLSDQAKNGTYKPYQSDLADIDVTTITGLNTSTNVREVIFADGMNRTADGDMDVIDLTNNTAERATYLIPSTYQELEYLESDQNAYINLNIYATVNTVVHLKVSDSNSWVFGRTAGANGRWGLDDAHFYSDNQSVGYTFSGIMDMVCDFGRGLTINGIDYNFSGAPVNPSNSVMYLFKASGSSAYPRGKIYFFDVYESGVLTMRLIPVRRISDSVLGMYDVVADTLFTNANTGSFIAGTNVYKAHALDTPITYTDLQDANGNPLNPRYKVEQGGTEQVLPVNTSTPTTVAPTLSTIYKKNA